MGYKETIQIYSNMIKKNIKTFYLNLKAKINEFLLIPKKIEKINVDIEHIYQRIVHIDDSINELKEIDFVSVGR